MQVLSNETYYLGLIMFIVILFMIFLSYFVSLRASKLYLSLQIEIYRGKTDRQ